MRKIIIILSCCTVLLLLGFVGYRGYHVWKEKKWMSMARAFAAKTDARNQMLCLQQVLRANARNVEACRMMAELTEAARSPSALVWRQRVLDLNPKATDDRLALAKTALVLRDYGAATNALETVAPAAKQTAAYHNLAGTIAISMGKSEAAETHFSEAARLEPWNSVPQLNLAVVRLHGTNSQEQAQARTGLRTVSLNSTNLDLRCLALRELVIDAIRFGQGDSALAFSSELLKQTNSVFSDRLLRLEVLRATKDVSFKPALATFQQEAADHPGNIFQLADWQITNLGPGEAMGWLKTLPMDTQTNQSVALVMAESRTLLQDWRGLQDALVIQNWGEMEFLRHAFLARALRGQDLTAAAQGEWGQARQSADIQKIRLTMLLQFAAKWRWRSEAEEILWTIVNQYPEDQVAFHGLAETLYNSGRTRPLMSLYVLQAKRQPADLGVKNNLAMTAMLLNAQELKPYDLAREVYQKTSTNAAYASTYGFSLYLQDKNADALKVFQALKLKELEHPAIAGYYGLVLKATGAKEKARAYLGVALKNPLLPEEQKLFESGRTGL